MKLYLVIIVTLLLSSQILAEDYFPGPFYWKENFSVLGKNFENQYSRTSSAPSHIPPDKHELFESVSLYGPYNNIQVKGFADGQEIFNVEYDVKEYGLRHTPAHLYKSPAKTHLIIAGDSNTFGYGVKVEETLPVLLASQFSLVHPYNFSVPGRGPNNTLALLEFFPWEKIIHEAKGTFIYNYYDFLLERTIGEKNHVATATGQSPWYELNSEDQIEYKGNFNDRFLTHVYKWIYSKKWLNDLLPVLPRYNLGHAKLVAKMFLKMKEEYQRKFPEGRFMVALNYFSFIKPFRLGDLAIELAKNNVEFVEVGKGQVVGPESIFPDSHLNSTGHKTEAKLFLEILSLNKIIR